VLLDVDLPDGSGVELCRQIKADPGLADVFVVLFSGLATTPEHKIAGLDAGADDYILKTTEPGEFLARIRTLVRLRDTAAALWSSDQLYRQVTENIQEVFWLTDVQKNQMIYVSPAYEAVWGRSCESLYASPWDWVEAIHPEDRSRVLTSARTKQVSGQYTEVYRITRPDGSVRWIRDRAFPIRDASGVVYRVVGIAEDVTERKQAETQLAVLADAVQSAQELICITDAENRFTFVNQAFLEAYRYGAEEILGKTADILYPPKPKQPPGLSEHIWQQTLAGGWRGELSNRRKDGTEFPISLSTSRIKDKDGRVIGLIGVARDISERRRAEKQAAAFAQLGHRLSGAATSEQAAAIILEIASELFGWDAGYLHLYSAAEDRLIRVLTMDTVAGQRKPVPPVGPGYRPSPLMRLVMKEGARLINSMGKVHSHIGLMPFGDTTRRSASMMYVPVHSEGAVEGVLSIQSYSREAYSESDLKILQVLADLCGGALLRIKAVEALREAEVNYRSIFENATEGIFRTTPEGGLLSANPALARMFGYTSPADLVSNVTNVGKQMYVQPKGREKLKRLLQTQGSVQGFETENYRKDGSRLWISLNGHVVRDVGGKVLYYEGTIQDITERWHAQHRLAEVVALNQAILGASAAGIMAYRKFGQCVFANEAAGRILGLSVRQLLRRNFRQLPAWEASGMLKLAEKTLRTRKLQSGEIRLGLPSGKEIWLDCSMATFESGGQSLLLVVEHEITERKQAEAELRQLPRLVIEAQEAERQRVARDLHDSVNQIIASAKLRLRHAEKTVAPHSVAAREMLARCGRLLVRALEENRRIAHNLRPSELDQLGLAAACRSLCQELQERTGLVVKCKVSRLLGRLGPAVELNLFRIVQEALYNVEKHARAKKVQVWLAAENHSMVAKIQDDGRGWRARRPSSSEAKRGGLGLRNMSERAASLGGTIQIKTAPNRGTLVTVRLPFKTEP